MLWKLIYNGFILGIKSIYPFYFIDYHKKSAQKFLKEAFNWEYYGGHHHENIFTKFNLSYWLPKKFGIDKRKITLSAQVLSGEISRQQALDILQTPPCDPEQMERDKTYVLKKLSISQNEFEKLMNSKNKLFMEYPSYYPLMEHFTILAGKIIGLFLPFKPLAFFQIEMRKKK
jgi:hypothetical protein